MIIKCAIFDFDGTLFDSMFIWEDVGDKYLASLGKKAKPSLRDDVRALSLYQSACYLKEQYDIDLSVDEIIKGINRTIEHFYIHEVQPKKGVISFLEEMKQLKIKMCIATASEYTHIKAALQRCKVDHYFEAIFTCAEVGHGKDEAIIFQKAMEHYNADRNNTIVFEDALHAIQTAKKDHFKVIGVFDKSEKRQEEIQKLCDFYMNDFNHTKAFWEFVNSIKEG